MSGGILVPQSGLLLDPSGRPIETTAPDLIGLDVVEAAGGLDILAATAALEDLRRRREAHGYLVIAPGQATMEFIADCAVFNAEVRARFDRPPRELTDADRERVREASRKRWRRAEKRRTQEERAIEKKRQEAAKRFQRVRLGLNP